MAATAPPAVTTAEELLRMPDDSMRHELVRGELRVMSPTGHRHGRVAGTIAVMLGTHARDTGCGVMCTAEVGYVLAQDPDTVRAPDVSFVSKQRLDEVGDTEKFWPGAPDLAVEMVSPNDTFREVQEKAREWVASGCIAVLVIDPEERTATVYRAGGESHIYGEGETVDLSDAVPGFSVTVAELFG